MKAPDNGLLVWDDALIIQIIFAFVCRSRQHWAIA